MKVLDIAVVIVVVLVALGLALLVGLVKQYQVGVMLFRLGWVLGPRRPGLHRIVPVVNALHRVWLPNMPIQSCIITRDNGSGMCRRRRISRPSASVLTSGAANG